MSLQTIRNRWINKKDSPCTEFLHYLVDHQEVPTPIPEEPKVIDINKYCLTLSWEKPLIGSYAPVLAYKIEKLQIRDEDVKELWKEVGITQSTLFDIYNLSPGEKYKFRVTPRNQYGWGKAVTTSLATEIENVPGYPEFEKCLPGELKILEYTSFVDLECKLKNNKDAQIEWLKDGILIVNTDQKFYISTKDDGRYCLTIQNLNEQDSARYQCKATNNYGTVTTSTRLLVVNEQRLRHEGNGKIDTVPEFSMKLRSRKVQRGHTVRLTCQVKGFPTPTVSWEKDGEKVTESMWITLNDEADDFHSLEINNTQPNHEGTYVAIATNSNGSSSSRCEIEVEKEIRKHVAPSFIRKFNNEYVIQEGDELRIRATVMSYPPAEIVWTKNETHLLPNTQINTIVNHDGEVQFTIAHARMIHDGIYTCSATNDSGNAILSTRIKVQPIKPNSMSTQADSDTNEGLPTYATEELYSEAVEPKFLIKPRSHYVTEGDQVIITCKVVGNPKPHVEWTRNRLKLNYQRDCEDIIIHNEKCNPFVYELEIPKVRLEHTGTYTVTASNVLGEEKSIVSLQVNPIDPWKYSVNDESKITLSPVSKIPKFSKPLSNINCCCGEFITLNCEIEDGNCSEVNFYWHKDGKLVPLDSDIKFGFIKNRANLLISKVQPKDAGKYTCTAINALGTASTSALLIISESKSEENIPPSNLADLEESILKINESKSLKKHPETEILPNAPKFCTIPQSRVIERGGDFLCNCIVSGHPTPSVVWYRNLVILRSDSKINLTIEECEDHNERLALLEIKHVKHDVEGLYTIVLENDYGRSESIVRLDVI